MNIENYEIEKYIKIFQEDKYFQVFLNQYGLKISQENYKNLLELLVQNKLAITEIPLEKITSPIELLDVSEIEASLPTEIFEEIVNLVEIDFERDEEEGEDPVFFLRNSIARILNIPFVPKDLYKNIFYTFKHSTLKKFFSENWKRFFPEYDVLNIESSEQLKLFQNSLMQQFDKFSDIIDEIYNLQDINLIPDKYLSYLAQLIGYEREERELLSNSSFRELIKNIIEIYRIKGTNFSFELFFGFLGFETSILEYWFDKRYFDEGIRFNSFTGSSEKNRFDFYLTPIKPTDTIPDGMFKPYSVLENQITETLGENEFSNLISSQRYSLEQILGEEKGYRETPYSFFKTNIVEFNISRFSSRTFTENEEIDDFADLQQGVSERDIRTIELYARFLTPIFISRRISIILTPFEDEAFSLVLKDQDRIDPKAINNPTKNERMFHLFEENIISGYFLDTYNMVFNPTDSNSVYSKVLQNNPSWWTQKEIYLEISRLIKTKEIFKEPYNVPDRDLLFPFVDFLIEKNIFHLLDVLENIEDEEIKIKSSFIEKVLFFMFSDFQFDFSAEYSVLEPYSDINKDLANGIFKKAFDEDDKGSIFDVVEKVKDFSYDVKNKKNIKQFAGKNNYFDRKNLGTFKKIFLLKPEEVTVAIRNSQNNYFSIFNKNFLLDFLDMVIPIEDEKLLVIKTQNEENVNITTEDEKLFAIEKKIPSYIW